MAAGQDHDQPNQRYDEGCRNAEPHQPSASVRIHEAPPFKQKWKVRRQRSEVRAVWRRSSHLRGLTSDVSLEAVVRNNLTVGSIAEVAKNRAIDAKRHRSNGTVGEDSANAVRVRRAEQELAIADPD